MSLDFVVLGEDGKPEKTVSIGVDLHHELIATAIYHGFGRFHEFEDYYEDAEIDVEELQDIAEQVNSLRRKNGYKGSWKSSLIAWRP